MGREYDAVIFDLFGTIVESFTHRMVEDMITGMANALDVPYGRFRELWKETIAPRARGDFRTAEANLRAVLEEMGLERESGAVSRSAQVRVEHTRRALRPRSDALATMEELRAGGLSLGLVSDCSWEVPPLWVTLPFAQLIREPVFSCEVGMKKPEPGIYHLACSRLGVDPGRCLYIGDGGSHELSGARAVGMTPVLIKVPSEEKAGEGGPDRNGDRPYRIEAEEWDGMSVASLSELIPIALGGEPR